jgi:chemotaxis protein methyltransferase CheR
MSPFSTSAATAPSSSGRPDYSPLRQIVFDHSQNVLDPSRDYLFESRLARILQQQGFSRIEQLIQMLRNQRNTILERQIAEAMTINETSFFRDGRPFELLRTELIPRFMESRRSVRSIRLWSAACSTGQEAYSLAMLLVEHFPSLSTGWKISIEGTDIASEVVSRARSGTYQRVEMNRGLPARNLVRFFDHHGEDWTAKPEIRQLCRFQMANLCADHLPFSPMAGLFDVIFLRNVMLYFSQETRIKLLSNIHRLLAPDGALFLGSSEQPADPSLWSAVLAGGTCYYRPR